MSGIDVLKSNSRNLQKELIGKKLEYKIQRKKVICCTNEKIT